MLFYDYHDAPNPRVVRMFAAEKGIALPIHALDLAGGETTRPPYITDINRTGQIPTLVLDNGFALREVLPICEYLEEVFPERPLIGASSRGAGGGADVDALHRLEILRNDVPSVHRCGRRNPCTLSSHQPITAIKRGA